MKTSTLILVMGVWLFATSGCGLLQTAKTPATSPTSASQAVENLSTQAIEVSPVGEVSPIAASKSNWLHFGVDDQFSSYKPDEIVINPQNVADLQLISGSGCDDETFTVIGATPALYDGQIILTYAGGKLEVGDPITLDMAWDFGKPAHGWAPPPVVSSDGIIYYLYVTPDSSSMLYAVDIKTQQKIWESTTQFGTGFSFDSQVTVDEQNGMVYVIEDQFGDGRLFALDRASGEIKWFIGEASQDEGITFVGSFVPMKEGKLYVSARVTEERGKRLRLVRVDPLTQQIDIQYDVPEELSLSWGVGWYGLCNDHVFETIQDNSGNPPILVAHPKDEPDIAWKLEIAPQSGRFSCDPQQGFLYVPTEKSLLAIEADTGTVLWEHKSLGDINTPTIANGLVYYLSETNMYALNQDDGSQLFRYPLGYNADPSTGVAVNDGLVVFSGSGGTCDLFVLGFK